MVKLLPRDLLFFFSESVIDEQLPVRPVYWAWLTVLPANSTSMRTETLRLLALPRRFPLSSETSRARAPGAPRCFPELGGNCLPCFLPFLILNITTPRPASQETMVDFS